MVLGSQPSVPQALGSDGLIDHFFDQLARVAPPRAIADELSVSVK